LILDRTKSGYVAPPTACAGEKAGSPLRRKKVSTGKPRKHGTLVSGLTSVDNLISFFLKDGVKSNKQAKQTQ